MNGINHATTKLKDAHKYILGITVEETSQQCDIKSILLLHIIYVSSLGAGAGGK
jgi:hypothetical protein